MKTNKSATQEFLKETYEEFTFSSDGRVFVGIRPRLILNDGFNISVQASYTHYCFPRENIPEGNYWEVELGYPSEEDELIQKYAEDEDIPTDTVYSYVPIKVVDELIAKHGGIKRD